MMLAKLTRRISISVIAGLSVTGVLAVLSEMYMRFVPYRDLPMMPRPVFFYAFAPGVFAALMTHAAGPLFHESIFWVANILAYAMAVFVLWTLLLAVVKPPLHK